MGRDKALIEIDGVAMAERVTVALRAAGASSVARIGDEVTDLHPGAGPLGGVITALRWSDEPLTVIAPCDLLAPDPDAFRALASALAGGEALAAVPAVDRPLPLALRRAALEPLAAAFAAGERSLHRALDGVPLVVVELPAVALADADAPEDLPPAPG